MKANALEAISGDNVLLQRSLQVEMRRSLNPTLPLFITTITTLPLFLYYY